VIQSPPTGSPEQPQRSGEKENPAPWRETEPVDVDQNQRDERRRDDRADGGAPVDDAHRGGAVADREPFRHRAGRRRKPATFADAEQQPAGRQRNHAAGQTMTGAGERPEDHDAKKSAAGPQFVQQHAAADIHQAVGDQKRGIEAGLDFIAERDVGLNRLNRPRQRLPVEVTDGNGGADQKCNRPTQPETMFS